jgi:hypothetical protein
MQLLSVIQKTTVPRHLEIGYPLAILLAVGYGAEGMYKEQASGSRSRPAVAYGKKRAIAIPTG